MERLTREELEALKRFPTPTVSNAIEMFNVRPRNVGFMLPDIKCLFPDLGVMVGYAATAVFRAMSPPDPSVQVDMKAYYEHILSVPEPRILVAQDLDSPPVGALFGEVNASLHQALGCVGHITNGGVRDLDEVRAIGFQFFAGCIQVSHAYVHMVDFGKPVNVGGVKVKPGDLIHADKHGVCIVPHEVAKDLAAACEEMERLERPLIELARSAEFSLENFMEARRQFLEDWQKAAEKFQRRQA